MTPDSQAANAAHQTHDDFRSAIGAVLLNDWDPHNAARLPESGAYDIYITPLVAMLQAGAAEEQIIDWLHEREKESMCFPPLGTRRLRSVAKKLVELGKREV